MEENPIQSRWKHIFPWTRLSDVKSKEENKLRPFWRHFISLFGDISLDFAYEYENWEGLKHEKESFAISASIIQ